MPKQVEKEIDIPLQKNYRNGVSADESGEKVERLQIAKKLKLEGVVGRIAEYFLQTERRQGREQRHAGTLYGEWRWSDSTR